MFQRSNYYVSGPSTAQQTLMFTNTNTGVGVTVPWNGVTLVKPNNEWRVMDIPDNLPDDTNFIDAHGIVIITNPSDHNLNFYLHFRAHGETHDYGPTIQAQAGSRDGERDSVFTRIPVNDRKFDMKWSIAGSRAQEAIEGGASMGYNINIVGYGTPFDNSSTQSQSFSENLQEQDVRNIIEKVMDERFNAPN